MQIDNENAEKRALPEVLQSEDAVLINDKIADNVANQKASETLDSLDAVKGFTEIHSDDDEVDRGACGGKLKKTCD